MTMSIKWSWKETEAVPVDKTGEVVKNIVVDGDGVIVEGVEVGIKVEGVVGGLDSSGLVQEVVSS